MSDLSDDEYSSDNIEQKFNKAAEYIQKNHSKFAANDLLEFYAYYKQSTCGRCNTLRPGIFNMQNRAKWDAWNNLGDLECSKAMKMYIEKLQKLVPNLSNIKSNEEDNKLKSQWVCTSSLVKEFEEDIPDEKKTPFDYIKEMNLEKLKTTVNSDNVNQFKDENSMSLIHWAADRNAPQILEYLISIGANVNEQDTELQTALHYAAACGHLKCIQILIDHKADKTVLDKDNLSCIDVAYDDTIKDFLKN